MQVTGIIAEYNPFHNGHLYQINKIRTQSDARIIAVMSGSFTQRGEATLLDKWERARLAVLCGCDLVLELPFVFACRSAQDFARGGVALLSRLGIVDTLAFGAEHDDITALTELAAELDKPAVQARLHQTVGQGRSYAQAITDILGTDNDTTCILHQPNNILALEYLRSLQLLSSPLKPLLIARQGAGYHEQSLAGTLASATAIRHHLYNSGAVKELQPSLPPAVYERLRNITATELPQMNRLLLPLQTKLLTSQIADLQACYGVNEGLENRICDCARQAADWTSLIRAVTTKRYPSSRIARTLMYLLLGLSSAEMAAFTGQGPLYARLLAASPRGKELLHSIKIHSSIPLLTKTSQYLTSQKRCQNPADLPPLAAMLRYDTLATDLRALTCPAGTARNDFQQSPLFLA